MPNAPLTDPRIVQAVEQSIAAYQGKRKVGRDKLLEYTKLSISFLADRASRGKTTNYSEVSSEIGIRNAQWGNVAFGSIRACSRYRLDFC